MNKVLEAVLMFQAHMLTARKDDERGQGTLEYVGMIIVAAAIVVAVLQASEAIDLGTFFTEAVNSVTGGGGS
ncbi:hypothetical protein GHK92_10710 [Nocardioides sp. dk4132]|uniref:hypothetical protein n=1 Tax=unclassified Nocardioides TaxID=2615069 RepID=UPI00129556E6|nr:MULTISPECIES: hypothetical protein [unclassified Nocardioides]MQW76348.1 hypothetical protein [Nocardioides sp. dk4132]QGA07373.1 hypothetical protein GFH29_08210 [Nocardioides sp. dk884]